MHYPVVTGLGVIAATGCGVAGMWEAVRAGRDGLKPLSLFASPRYGPVLAGEVGLDLIRLGAPLPASRTDRLGWLAAREALRSAGLDTKDHGDAAGIVLGCSVGGSFDSEGFLTTLIKRRKMRLRPARFHECSSAVDLIANDFGLFGPTLAIATACSSGALAIAAAAEMIQAGEASLMLAGGADSLARITWAGFHSLLLVDGQGCRPFDAGRAGMSLGEGAGVLVLESEENARRRGAPILARLAGWGASCDAYHATTPHPAGEGAEAAMRSALQRAGLEPAAIDYINAHGTGTRENDVAEARALQAVFGNGVPPFSSTKRAFGHALAASGAIEAVVCIEALRHQELPPNPGFTRPDAAINLEPITVARAAKLSHVMSNSFGFGGNNATLVFSAPESAPRSRAAKLAPVAVTGLGMIGPGAVAQRLIEAPLPPGELKVRSCHLQFNANSLTPNQRRRMSRIHQMAVLAARSAQTPGTNGRVAVALGTGYGCLEDGAVLIETQISKDEGNPMPSRFPKSVHNAPSGQVAMDLGARGLNSAPTAGETTFECALWQAWRQIDADEADVALAGAVDELQKYPLAMGKRWKVWTEQTVPGEGVVVARLASATAAAPALARVTALRLGRFRKPFAPAVEADWIARNVDLANVGIFLSGAGGYRILETPYHAVAEAISARAGRPVEHQTYKQHCGEFPSASAFGFSVAVQLARERGCGVLLYTLSLRGGKALCLVQP